MPLVETVACAQLQLSAFLRMHTFAIVTRHVRQLLQLTAFICVHRFATVICHVHKLLHTAGLRCWVRCHVFAAL